MPQEPLPLIGLIAGAALAVLIVIGLIISSFYRKATKERAFVRTGMGGQKVMMNGGSFVDPVIHVLVLVRFALLVERDQQDVRLFLGQYHMPGMPVARVKRLTKQRRNVFANEGFTNGQIERVDDVAQACERAHLVCGW
jgi:hypothetical protein